MDRQRKLWHSPKPPCVRQIQPINLRVSFQFSENGFSIKNLHVLREIILFRARMNWSNCTTTCNVQSSSFTKNRNLSHGRLGEATKKNRNMKLKIELMSLFMVFILQRKLCFIDLQLGHCWDVTIWRTMMADWKWREEICGDGYALLFQCRFAPLITGKTKKVRRLSS